MPQRVLEPGSIESASGAEIPFLRLPDRNRLFAERAARLRDIARGHPMGDYLQLVAKIADAQHWALGNLPAVMLPGPAHVEQCRQHGMPALNVQTHARDRAWCEVLRLMLRRIAGETEGKVQDIAVRLERERDELYEAQASKLLAGISFGLDLGNAPFVGAALQVYWLHMATTLGPQAFGRTDAPTVCPCCGSRPVASIVRLGARDNGLRFLHCSLCSAEWQMARIQCTSCESTKGIFYHGIEGGSRAAKAESCDECGTYLKIFYQEYEPQSEPTADDLASLAIDLLMSDTGKLRSGQNLMLVQGEEA